MMKLALRLSGCFLAGALLTVNRGASQAPSIPAVNKEAIVKAAIIGYASNVQAFSFYRCHYRYTKAQAKSIEDAISGRFINAVSYDNRLLVDGDKDLYEGLAPGVLPDPKQGIPVPGKKGLFIVPALVSSDRYLADGKREMNYCPQLRSVGLWSNEKSHSQIIAHTPLGLHLVGHRNARGPDVLMTQTDKYEMFSDGLQELDGRPVVTVRLKQRNIQHGGSPQVTLVFSLDGAKGYLPARIVMLWNDKPKMQVFVTGIRECSDQRWFPERWVEVDTPDKAGAPFDVAELQLLHLDADHHPAPSDFAFPIPAGTSVCDQEDGRRFFKLKQDENIRLQDLPTLFTMLDQVQDNALMDTAIHHANPYRWVVAAIGLTLALAGAAFLMRRRWLARRLSA